MIKILANDGITDSGKEILVSHGFEVDDNHKEVDELLSVISQYDCLLVRSATKVIPEVLDHGEKLKIVGRGGVGLDNIDLDYAKLKNVQVVNTPGASSQSVAELVLAHMFTGARFLHDSNRKMPEEGDSKFKTLKKTYSKGSELKGKNVGIIGFGRIGQALAKMSIGIGMYVMAHDMMKSGKENIELDQFKINNNPIQVSIIMRDLDKVLRNSDYISIHTPFKSGSKPIIGKDEIAKMKDGVKIINAARGGAVDEQALLDALNSGKVSFAGLDVYENEPNPNRALLEHPNVSLTSHTGASTLEAQERVWEEMAHTLIDFFKV
jgi:D-3-phosphoglycerate dehydrogenase / 2-oxoglutarate reductase